MKLWRRFSEERPAKASYHDYDVSVSHTAHAVLDASALVDDDAQAFDLSSSAPGKRTSTHEPAPADAALTPSTTHRTAYRTHTQELLSGSHRLQWSTAAKGILCGVAAGLLVVAYRAAIAYGNSWAVGLYAFLAAHPLAIAGWAVAAILAAAAIAKLVTWEPMAAGSGIPQVEGVLLWGLKMRWWSILLVRFSAGIVCGFFGMSLGREGPSIQIGAAAAQGVAAKLGRSRVEQENFIAAGAAAGLSAAFSAPLSGMMFALEEVYRSFSPVVLFTATTAALTADFLSKLFLGFMPVLKFTAIAQMDLATYAWLVPLGVVSGLTGAAMNKLLLDMQTALGHLSAFWRILLALALALGVGLAFPLALGGGGSLIRFAEQGGGTMLLLAALLLVKMLFTATSFGSGVPGGIFLPILTVGAVAGSLFARTMEFSLDQKYVSTFAVLAMAGALASSVKAPITSMLLVIEMSGSLVHMFPVAAVTLISLLVSDALHVKPIYHALLDRYMAKNHPEKRESTVDSGLMALPVELGSSILGKAIRDVAWPADTQVVSVRRAGREFVPNARTIIHPGDGLVVLYTGTNQRTAREALSVLCSAAY
ncbi:sodium:proton antiporter [Alloscardovia macacae]|uniref:Sodium:proton antiporter n=2 Tax=Alloscardovia macacae TaxID=1160091 RepID=A0A1Y2SUK0_9BIFI|nr:sodium:proton antiporter [Alloscardovia macacae]OTA28100.1 sodium:proton antiporter [Alloscardovia macacae]